MKASRFTAVATCLLLGSCGRVADLQPAAGHSLPVKPVMARVTPTAQDLLVVPTVARPDRVDELVKKSQPRQADPFELPPPTGGAAPALPAGSDPGAVTNNVTVANPGD